MNGKNSGNNYQSNGAIEKKTLDLYQTAETLYDDFDQPIILRQSPIWSRLIVWTLMAVSVASVSWAAIAKIEQVVPAMGQLKPIGRVQEVQAPVNGVIDRVEIKDGDFVEKDQVLMVFDTRSTEAEIKSLNAVLQSLRQENNFYRTIMNQGLQSNVIETEIIRLDLPQEVALLARNRTNLVEENRFLQALLAGGNVVSLDPQQQARLNITKEESNARITADQLEIEKLEKQLAQNRIKNQNAQDRLATETEILNSISTLLEDGAIPRLQYTRQLQQVENIKAELKELREEEQRLNIDIDQKQKTLRSTTAIYERDTRNQLALNQQRIAELDSQLTKIIVENEKQISDIDKKIKQMVVTLDFQEIKAPVSGTVFDLKATRGYVPSPSQRDPLLKIVPPSDLFAEIFVTNKDIGFLELGMNVDIRIDSYPFSEFGDIDGKIVLIGSDALPPDQFNQFYRFPVRVELSQQYPGSSENLKLLSGMSVTANIKVQEERTVLSLLIDKFIKTKDSLKTVR